MLSPPTAPEALLQRRADPSPRNERGLTPLDAASLSCAPVMETLLERWGVPLCRAVSHFRAPLVLSDLCHVRALLVLSAVSHFRAPLVSSDLCHVGAILATDSLQAFAAPPAPAGATRAVERRQNPGQGRRRYREAEGKGKEGKGKGKAGRKG